MERIEIIRRLLDLSGIGSDRVQIRWVSASEGQIFADQIKELSQLIQEKGPFEAGKFQLQLGAIQTTLSAPRIRWLVGIDRQVTQHDNVYRERIDSQQFKLLLDSAVESEYHQSLILELLKKAPHSVRELSAATGLPVYTVSLRLGDLERSGRADLHAYEGITPRFTSIAA